MLFLALLYFLDAPLSLRIQDVEPLLVCHLEYSMSFLFHSCDITLTLNTSSLLSLPVTPLGESLVFAFQVRHTYYKCSFQFSLVFYDIHHMHTCLTVVTLLILDCHFHAGRSQLGLLPWHIVGVQHNDWYIVGTQKSICRTNKEQIHEQKLLNKCLVAEHFCVSLSIQQLSF